MAAMTPTWVSTASGLSNVVSTFAILVGGSWAYLKYMRGSIHSTSCSLGVEGELVTTGDGELSGRGFLISCDIRNSGTVRLNFADDLACEVMVQYLTRQAWEDCRAEDVEVQWAFVPLVVRQIFHPNVCDEFAFMDPGEERRVSLLEPLPDEAVVAARVTVEVRATGHMTLRNRSGLLWSTNQIFTASPKDVSDGE